MADDVYVRAYIWTAVGMSSSKLFLAQLRLLVLGASWGTADWVSKISKVSRKNTSSSIQILCTISKRKMGNDW